MADEIVDTSASADATQNDVTAADKTTTTVDQTATTTTDTAVDKTTETTTEEVKGKWPEDWRNTYAKGDEKLMKQLARYASPEAALDALFAAQKRISQGELGPKKPGKDAAPEELQKYREALGVPEKPESYFDKLPNGLVIGEDDKELFDSFASAMHEMNVPTDAMHKVVDWYYNLQEDAAQKQFEADRTAHDEAMVKLRDEYGMTYKAQFQSAENWLAGRSPEFLEALKNAVDPNGVQLLNNHAIIRELINLANDSNPVASVIPGASNVSSIDDELTKIANLQRTNPKEYYSDKVQARELQLLQAKEKLQARA